MIKKIKKITNARIKNANYLNNNLKYISQIELHSKKKKNINLFIIYINFFVKEEMNSTFSKKKIKLIVKFIILNLYICMMQLRNLNIKKGNLLMQKTCSKKVISIPVHEYVKKRTRSNYK